MAGPTTILAALLSFGCSERVAPEDPLARARATIGEITSLPDGDRGDRDARLEEAFRVLDARDDLASQELVFQAADLLSRHSLEPAARTRAIELGERVLARGLPGRCTVAQRVALLVGEAEGKDAMRGRLVDLQRDAELAHAAECQASTGLLLSGLGARARAVGLGGTAPRLDSLTPLFAESSARVVLALEAEADPAVLSAIRVRDDRLSAGTVTSVHLPGILADAIAREIPGEGLLTRIVTTPASDGTDVRFELSASGSKRVHFLLEPPRVVVDLAPAEQLRRAGRTVRRIVLDPGHGGFDPGAIGPTGLREKDIALDVSLRAARALRVGGFEVHLTRDGDRAVPIVNRSAMANALDADLFVSVHCNASESAQGHGIETYLLDDARGPKDASIAVQVAARENGASQGSVVALSGLLAQTRVREHSERSHAFAEKLQRHAVSAVRAEHADARDGGVHPAAFSVLVGARMPAVLFETSYVSNPRESARLGTPAYRQTLADALVKAVTEFSR